MLELNLGSVHGMAERERLGMVSTWAATCMVKITISPGSAHGESSFATPELASWHLCPSCCLDNICRHIFSSGEGNVYNLTSNVIHWWRLGICIRLTLWHYFHILSMLSFANCFTFYLNQFCIAAFLMKCYDFLSPGSHGEFVGVHVLPLLPGV